MTALCGKTVFFALLAPLLLAPAIATPLATLARAEDTNPGNADNGMVLQADPAARAAEREHLFATLAAARNEAEAKSAADQIWLFWFRPPDAQSGKLMSEAMERRRAYDLSGAVEILDRLVLETPDWAEAWNQRATLRFLLEDYEGSLADIERVLQLEPKHFGAMAGQVLILMRHGRFDTAQSILRKAVEINPFLAERSMLIDEPKGNGKDI